MTAQHDQERFSLSKLYFGSWRPNTSHTLLWVSCIHQFTKEPVGYYGDGELLSAIHIAHTLNMLTGKANHFKMIEMEESPYWLGQITLFVGRLVLLGRSDLKERFLKLQERHQCNFSNFSCQLETLLLTREIGEIALVLKKIPSPERKSLQDLFKEESKSSPKRTLTPPPSTSIPTMTPKQLVKMDLEELTWIHSPSGLKELSIVTSLESDDEIPTIGLLKCT
jgi:hypothetical protein